MPRPATWGWWRKGTGCSRNTPWSVATGERTMPPTTQSRKPMTKTAPKIVTRESVFALRWKICAIEIQRFAKRSSHCGRLMPSVASPATVRAIIYKTGSGATLRGSARSPFMSRANARDPARDDEGHHAGAVGVEPLHALARHDHEAARHAVRERQIDGHVSRHGQEVELLLRDEAERADGAVRRQRDRHRLVQALLMAHGDTKNVGEGKE